MNKLNRKLDPANARFAAVCAAAGCSFTGVQPACPEAGLEAIVLFDDRFGSSLGLAASKFNLEAVTRELRKSEALWRKGRSFRSKFAGGCVNCGESTESIVKMGDGAEFLCVECGSLLRGTGARRREGLARIA